jgi:hypothetical protein
MGKFWHLDINAINSSQPKFIRQCNWLNGSRTYQPNLSWTENLKKRLWNKSCMWWFKCSIQNHKSCNLLFSELFARAIYPTNCQFWTYNQPLNAYVRWLFPTMSLTFSKTLDVPSTTSPWSSHILQEERILKTKLHSSRLLRVSQLHSF